MPPVSGAVAAFLMLGWMGALFATFLILGLIGHLCGALFLWLCNRAERRRPPCRYALVDYSEWPVGR